MGTKRAFRVFSANIFSRIFLIAIKSNLHGGRVATVLVALADVGVVLLQHRGVAVALLVALPAAATDHTLVSTH